MAPPVSTAAWSSHNNCGNNRHAVIDHTDDAAFLDSLAQTQTRYPFCKFGYRSHAKNKAC